MNLLSNIISQLKRRFGISLNLKALHLLKKTMKLNILLILVQS